MSGMRRSASEITSATRNYHFQEKFILYVLCMCLKIFENWQPYLQHNVGLGWDLIAVRLTIMVKSEALFFTAYFIRGVKVVNLFNLCIPGILDYTFYFSEHGGFATL